METGFGRPAGEDPPEEAVEADPEKTGRKRLGAVVVLLAAEGSQGGLFEAAESRGRRSEEKMEIGQPFEGAARFEGPSVGLRTETAKANRTGRGCDDLAPQIGRQHQAVVPKPGHQSVTPAQRSLIFHRDKISKNELQDPGPKLHAGTQYPRKCGSNGPEFGRMSL